MSSVKELLRGDVIDGSGTANYIPKFIDTNTIGNSAIYESSGNIGIGTTSPANTLHVVTSSGFHTLDSVGGVSLIDFRTTGNTTQGGVAIGADAVNTLSFRTASTERMVIDSSGNLGVGTSSPDTIINAAATDNTILRLESTDTSPSTNQKLGGVEFYGNGSTLGAGVYGSLNGFYEDTAGRSYLTLSTRTSTGLFERMRINSSGNVGIGTSSITSGGGFTPKLVLSDSSFPALIVRGSDGQEGTVAIGGGLRFDSAGHSDATNNNIIFRTGPTNSNYSTTERMRITSGGDLLLGNGSNLGRLRVDSLAISAGTNNNMFDFTGLTAGVYLVSVARITSTGTKWIGTVAHTGSSVFVQTVIDANGISATQSGALFRVNPTSSFSVSGTVIPLTLD